MTSCSRMRLYTMPTRRHNHNNYTNVSNPVTTNQMGANVFVCWCINNERRACGLLSSLVLVVHDFRVLVQNPLNQKPIAALHRLRLKRALSHFLAPHLLLQRAPSLAGLRVDMKIERLRYRAPPRALLRRIVPRKRPILPLLLFVL